MSKGGVLTVSLVASLAVLGAACQAEAIPEPGEVWRTLEPGLELGEFAATQESEVGDSVVRVLRIDPRYFELRLLNASATPEGVSRTARQWCQSPDLVAAINASMYQEDHKTSVSLMKTASHVNNSRLSEDNTLLAFDRLTADVPEVRIIDRECDDLDALRAKYGTLVQSIRMVSCAKRNVWTRQEKRWSTAAIALDHAGRVLFLHVRSPYVTHDLINILMKLPLDISGAMYVEGGPEAQLYVRHGTQEHAFVGSYETGFLPNDSNTRAWAVPNVIAVARRVTPADP